jgi:hypothetical protein
MFGPNLYYKLKENIFSKLNLSYIHLAENRDGNEYFNISLGTGG